jgi:hypothetical protein
MVFKTIHALLSVPASTWAFSVATLEVIQDHPAYPALVPMECAIDVLRMASSAQPK